MTAAMAGIIARSDRIDDLFRNDERRITAAFLRHSTFPG